MTPYDVKREFKHCYAPKNLDWELVDVPEQRFIAVDGRGDPNTSADYASAVEALYAVAYTIKFASKRTIDLDFVVGPLEGLWWADDPQAFASRAKDSWRWRMLISQPEWITEDMIGDAKQVAQTKKGLPVTPKYAMRPCVSAAALRSCTSGHMTKKGPCWPGSTTSGSTPTSCGCRGCTMRSTSATADGPTPHNSRRSFANPCNRPCDCPGPRTPTSTLEMQVRDLSVIARLEADGRCSPVVSGEGLGSGDRPSNRGAR